MHLRSLLLLYFLPVFTCFWGARLATQSLLSGPARELSPAAQRPPEIPETDPYFRSAWAPGATTNSRDAAESLLSPEQILNTLERAGNTPADRLQLFESLARMDSDALLQFLNAEAHSTNASSLEKDSDLRTACFQFAAERLVQGAPEKAADFWSTHRDLPVSSLLSPWACKNPEDFALWWKKQPKEIQSDSSAAIYALAMNSPETWNRVSPLFESSPTAWKAAYQGQFSPTLDQMIVGDSAFKAESATHFVLSLPEGPLREEILPSLLSDLFFSAKPEECEAHLQKYPELKKALAQLPEDQAERLRKLHPNAFPPSVSDKVSRLAGEDPSAAMEFAMTLGSNSPERTKALVTAADALYKKDPESTRRWVETAPLTDEDYQLLTGRPRSKK